VGSALGYAIVKVLGGAGKSGAERALLWVLERRNS
jgi:hypothetical protein